MFTRKLFKIAFAAAVCLLAVLVGFGTATGIAADATVTDTTADDRPESRRLPVVMYHSVLKSRSNEYIVSPAILDADLKALKAAGYQSVTTDELIAFVDGTGNLPPKPVLITFDDGFYNNVYYAESVLRENGFTAVLSVVGSYCNYPAGSKEIHHPAYSYVNWEDIKETAERGTFEIGNHTFNMHNYQPRFGVTPLPGEADQSFRRAVREDVTKLQTTLRDKCGIEPKCFAYPYGRTHKSAKEVLSELGFRVVFNCFEEVNTIVRGDRERLMRLTRFNRDPRYSQSQLLEKFKK